MSKKALLTGSLKKNPVVAVNVPEQESKRLILHVDNVFCVFCPDTIPTCGPAEASLVDNVFSAFCFNTISSPLVD